MPKSTSRSNSKSSNKSSSRQNSPTNTSGRSRRMAPKAGVTKHRSRYQDGGEFCY